MYQGFDVKIKESRNFWRGIFGAGILGGFEKAQF
jgi:hypothetical protein